MAALDRRHLNFITNILKTKFFGDGMVVTLGYTAYQGNGVDHTITINGIPIGFNRQGANSTAWIIGRTGTRYFFTNLATFDSALLLYNAEPQ